VTRAINVMENIYNTPAQRNARKTHCKHGHLYDAANTYYGPRGRDCKTCRRAADRRRQRPAAA
jgi:hypothetical protein